MAHYIFGYGSLMNSASRLLTGQTATAVPAVAHGYQRLWGKVNDDYHHSPLVVTPGDGLVNGMLLKTDALQLKEFDRREHGYQRTEINHPQLDCDHLFSSQDSVWIYIRPDSQPPCERSPIMQTYVDTVLSGCLEVSEQFAKQFIQHTHGWDRPLENDRHQPKYGNRVDVQPQILSHIDALLVNALGFI
ncbi:gamma-glutamylcyclotransferase family protein [Vibrio sp.]|uniref:gamma-glutamylcyclotransferase family protein n=1 Tax=Vibrio sp. TaxID=678 RepID=UPI003D0C5C25